MKKIAVVFLILLGAFVSHAQKDSAEKRYYYNFRTKTLYKKPSYTEQAFAPLKYKAGRDINIEIKHFNPLQYEISIEESNSNFFLVDTAKWSSRIVIPSIPNAPASTTTTVSAAVHNSCDDLNEAIKELTDQKNNLQKAMTAYKNLVTTIEDINNTYENLKALSELSTTGVSASLINTFLEPLNAFLSANHSPLVNTKPTFVSSGDLAKKEMEFYDSIKIQWEEIKTLKATVDAIKNSSTCGNFLNLYKQFRDAYETITKSFTDLDAARSDHLATFKNTVALYDRLKRYAIEEPGMVTGAITIEKDLHTITIKTKTGTAQPVVYDNIHIQPYRGMKVDVATGFFFSNLSDQSFFKHSMDSIHSKKYLVNGVARDTLVQESYTAIYEKNNAHLSFGGMIYLQAHTQNPGNWNGGGYLGFGALFNDQARWSGAAGGTLLIGQKQRFNIHAGLILSQVDRLAPPYQTDTWYRETIDNIPTYRAWKAGFMFGFSWNL